MFGLGRNFKAKSLNQPRHQQLRAAQQVAVSGATAGAARVESIVIPSSSNPTWGGYFTLNYNQLNTEVLGLTLQFNLTALGGTTVTRFVPASLFIDRVELVQSGNIISTNYGLEQWINLQLFHNDEDRRIINTLIGDYSSTAQRQTMAASSNTYYAPIMSYISVAGGIPVLDQSQTIEIRVYMNSLVNATAPAGAPTNTINSVNLIAKVRRLTEGDAFKKKQILNNPATPFQSRFCELRYMQGININSGVSSTNITLNAINGNISHLFFVLRAVGSTANDSAFSFAKLDSFRILDAANQDISGGQPIRDEQCLHLYGREWTLSSYLSETVHGTTDRGAHVFLYSFCSDPAEAMRTGFADYSHPFSGSEQLQLNFAGSLPSAHVLDVFAYNTAMVEIGRSGVRKFNY
jgi:hypothetical protein